MGHRPERLEQVAVEALGDLDAAHAIGQGQHAVVGRGLAVDRDRIKGEPARVRERARQQHGIHRRVRRQVAQHRGHARLDHARALGHAADAKRADGGAHFDRVFLRERVGGHDAASGRCAALGTERRGGLRYAGAQLVHLQVDADHARGADQHLLHIAADGRGRQGRHFTRIGHALRPGAGVGATAVGDHGTGPATGGGEVFLAHEQRRRLGEVEREHTSGLRGRVADDQ